MTRLYLDTASFRPISNLSSSRSISKQNISSSTSRLFKKTYTPHSSLQCAENRKRRKKRRRTTSLVQRSKYDSEESDQERRAKKRAFSSSSGIKHSLEEPFQNRPSKVIKLKKNVIWSERSNSTRLSSINGATRYAGKTIEDKKTSDDHGQLERRCKVASYAARITQHRIHSRKIKSSWVAMPTSAQKGIYNPAVLCYRNSLLQALLHTPKIVNWLRTYHGLEKCILRGSPCVACRLLAVFESYWGSTPKDLLYATKELDKVFRMSGWQGGRTGRQEDPEEQFVWIAKMLSDQLPTIQFDAFEAISRFMLNSSTKCSSCGYMSVNEGEVEGTISVDLQPKIKNGTVADYLEPYFSYRVEGFKCDGCSSRSPKWRTRAIYHQPETLVIQLKRFGWDGRKNSIPIPFSSSLSLDRYRSEENTPSCEYDLSAIICHSGGMNSGHYVCRAKGPDDRWMKFDDLQVTKITKEQALHPGTKNGWTPYLLFYQRKVK